jgi:uncharacterized membrane protein YqiK
LTDQGNATVETAIRRIRDLNDKIVDAAREGGTEAVETYERLLENLADAQDEAGERGADWVREFANAQAAFTRQLASAFPSLLQRIGRHGRALGEAATEQARRVPGVGQAEGLVRGALSREGDLPIADYDQLTVEQIVERLPGMSESDRTKVQVYESRTKNRKGVHDAIDKLR